MSGSPNKRKSEVIWSEHAYSVATDGGLGPFCQPEIGLEIENKRPCLGVLVPAATTKPAAFHVGPAQRTIPVEGTVEVEVAALEEMEIVEEPRPAPSGKEKHQENAAVDQIPRRNVPAPATSDHKQKCHRLSFPAGHGKTASELFSWFAALLKQHPDPRPAATLQGGAEPALHHATHINVILIKVPAGFHGLKRRIVGQMARPQLLGVVTGKVPSEVHLLGLGRRRVERYTPEPDLCRHCSRWGHKEWRCQSTHGCRYYTGPHKSAQCLDKIKKGTKIPPRCCNCRGDHNAHSTFCTVRPRPQREPAKHEVSQRRLVFYQAPPLQTNAWATKPSFLAAAPHLSQPSCPTTGISNTSAVFPPLPQRTATVLPVPPEKVP
ncbi:hypothetical protein E2C01_050109 [Portunus trituberculatus]|uniref:Nucleic-acid-binding protein from transposon X-element n=1 Tax=Portunus trituberculatus TaxID=210409 RepID=A0A5B7GF04_PORTR|nr:hypothetical protein [Portunus trituberculatus]